MAPHEPPDEEHEGLVDGWALIFSGDLVTPSLDLQRRIDRGELPVAPIGVEALAPEEEEVQIDTPVPALPRTPDFVRIPRAEHAQLLADRRELRRLQAEHGRLVAAGIAFAVALSSEG